MGSSSGGLAAAIERSFVKNGGMVCSCVFRSGRFEFDFAETEDDVSKFAGSKYIKSSPEGIYSKIAERLKAGNKILFVKIPPQIYYRVLLLF